MVDPAAQVELARQIALARTEEAIRTVVSRCYYAAFWHCRAYVEDRLGPLESTGSAVHRELSEKLRLLSIEAADALLLLRLRRNRADYDVSRAARPELAFDSLVQAQRLLELL